jgi:hypothetical protein
VLLHREGAVQPCHLRRVVEIDAGQHVPADDVGDARCVHRRADAMTRDIQQEARENAPIEELMPNRPAEMRGHEPPIRY